MKWVNSLVSRVESLRRVAQEKRFGRYKGELDRDLTFTQAVAAYPEPDSLYAYMHHHYFHRCPHVLRAHREYFKQDQRGFGEDAFHAMWWLLLSEFKPLRMLEIGIYRGQTISLWALISQQLGQPCEIHGISPFSSTGDAVSRYPKDFDYMADIMGTFSYWKLTPPQFVRALSTDPTSIAHIRSRKWDLVYIDGSHEYETVLADYKICRDNLNESGILIFDDASLGTSFIPPIFSFSGHPGPSRVAQENAAKEMRFLGAVGHNNLFMNI